MLDEFSRRRRGRPKRRTSRAPDAMHTSCRKGVDEGFHNHVHTAIPAREPTASAATSLSRGPGPPRRPRPGQTKAAARHPNCTALAAHARQPAAARGHAESMPLSHRSARVAAACQRLPADRACPAGKHKRDMLAGRHVGRDQDQQKPRGRMLRHV